MKKAFKIFFKILKYSTILLFSIYIGYFIYLYFGWRLYYTKQEINRYSSNIENAQSLSPTFYSIYDKLYKSERHNIITIDYFKIFWTEISNKKYWGIKAAKMINNNNSLKPFCLAFKLEQETTPEKCFDYCIQEEYKNYITKFPTDVKLDNINDTTQILRFLVAKKGVTLYSKSNERLNDMVETLKEQLKEE